MGEESNLKHNLEQSNPFSTGGGGVDFEVKVQSCFAAYMLLNWKIPNINSSKINKIKLQGKYAGYDTDDCIVYTEDGDKMLCQIKHSISITKSDIEFSKVINSAWNDFNNESLFNKDKDIISLIVSALSQADSQNVRRIFEWAKTCEDEVEFIKKIYTPQFSSKEKQAKYEIIKHHLQKCKRDITNAEIWSFFKVFTIQIMEVDIPDSHINTAVRSALEELTEQDNFAEKLYYYVANMNKNAGTVLIENAKKDLGVTDKMQNSEITEYYDILRNHTNLIFENMHNSVGGISIKRDDELQKIQQSLESNKFVLVTGQRGSGKSGVVKEFWENHCKDKYSLAIRSEELSQPTIQSVFNSLGISLSVKKLFDSLSLYNEKILFIESLEKVVELENKKAFLDLLSIIAKDSEWKIIASVRNYAVQQIIMNFISEHLINYDVIDINDFLKEEIKEFIEKVPKLKVISCNSEVLELVKNPFYLSSVYKILNAGYTISDKDSKDTIKSAIWDTVIRKDAERVNGMPQKRDTCFIEIALKRARTMKYAVDANEFNPEALLKLEEDGLIIVKYGLVCLSHDVFEDWAIERFIEKQYKLYNSDTSEFLQQIGCEQSICRAYRLWLKEKTDEKDFISEYIQNLFNSTNLKSIWYDETLSAIIFSNKLDIFLDLLKDLLFQEDCKLLKRVCFMISVTSRRPNMDLISLAQNENEIKKASFINLKPHGKCWRQIIQFLYVHRQNLSADMYIHCVNILKEWSTIININNELPVEAKEAGLLSLFIVDKIRDDYSVKESIKTVFTVVLITYERITKEFNLFVEDTIFNNEKRKRHSYIDDFAEQIYSSIDTAFIAKNAPDLLIKIAKREWLLREQPPKDLSSFPFHHMSSSIRDEDIYGLKSSSIREYFPASGEREPFRSLFKYFPKKAIDFVIELCNIASETYINNYIKEYNQEEKENILKNIKCELKKEDGTIIKQYAVGNFWGAYRGVSNVPNLIQSALMSLENYLISNFEYFKENQDEIEYCINYIITNSNSVFTTSVLTSVAHPYYKSMGKSSLLLLQCNSFYDMDISRMIQEMGENEPNWFGMNNDIFRNLYIADRRKAATREWRKETLEELCVKLQLTTLRDDVYKIIDELDKQYHDDENWKFRMNRIDTRKYKFELDEVNNQIICTSGEIKDENLIKIVEDNKEKTTRMNRFMAIEIWSYNAIKGEINLDKFENATKLLEEIKDLLRIYPKLNKDEKSQLYYTGIIQAMAIIYKDFRRDLDEQEILYCKEFMINEFKKYDKSLDVITGNGRIDNNGFWIVSEIFPLFSDYLTENELVKLLITGLTCCDVDVRLHTAIGIGKYLWEINKNIVEKLINVIIYFDLLDIKKQIEARTIIYNKKMKLKCSYSNWINNIRKDLIKISDFSRIDGNEEDCSLYAITMRMLMLPKNYNKDFDEIIKNTLTRISLAEKDIHDYRKEDRNKNSEYFNVRNYYTIFFGNYFYQMEKCDLEKYYESIKIACNNAPDFMKWTLIHYKRLTEREKDSKKYWGFWNFISDIMREISKELNKGENYKYDERRKILEEYIYLDTPWQSIDFKNPPIKEGVRYICDFTKESIQNPLVFEGISSLIYNFPKLILNEGLLTFNGLSEKEIENNLKKSNNSIFYLENILHSYIINLENNTLQNQIYNICEKILNSLVECASSKAYYVREYLIKSKKIG
ncbi:MAG: hypothetical protein LBL91_02130 [Lachnospiraceae bacterium]|jgi:ABC-type cobalamin/Fe3+-siderophores transport system ATPase subunit|nr:hypothetical protein [Lachnospiraceae bacterium]